MDSIYLDSIVPKLNFNPTEKAIASNNLLRSYKSKFEEQYNSLKKSEGFDDKAVKEALFESLEIIIESYSELNKEDRLALVFWPPCVPP